MYQQPWRRIHRQFYGKISMTWTIVIEEIDIFSHVISPPESIIHEFMLSLLTVRALKELPLCAKDPVPFILPVVGGIVAGVKKSSFPLAQTNIMTDCDRWR